MQNKVREPYVQNVKCAELGCDKKSDKKCRNKFDENLKKRFSNICKLFNHDINKCNVLLQNVFTHVNIWKMKRHYL